MVKAKKTANWLHNSASRITKIHFMYVMLHFGLIIIFDSWNLLTKDSVGARWTTIGVLFALNALLWFVSRASGRPSWVYRSSIVTLAVYDLWLAGMYVYWERGMASINVALFFVPIIVVAGLRSRGALLTVALIAAAGYSTSVIRYFNDNYGEGFRVQVYGTVVFYGLMFFFIAWLLISALSTPKREPR